MKLTSKVKLEQGETVEYIFRRSPILNILIVAGEIFITFAFIAFLIYVRSVPSISDNFFFMNDATTRNSMFLIVGILYLVLLLAGLISIYVNRSNILFITNHRLIQNSTTTLISQSLNIISLRHVEDVSFKQTSLLDHIFRLGQLRLSTVGDETTYTFSYVDAVSDETLSQVSDLISGRKKHYEEKPLD